MPSSFVYQNWSSEMVCRCWLYINPRQDREHITYSKRSTGCWPGQGCYSPYPTSFQKSTCKRHFSLCQARFSVCLCYNSKCLQSAMLSFNFLVEHMFHEGLEIYSHCSWFRLPYCNWREDKVTRCQCVHPIKYNESLRQDMFSLWFKLQESWDSFDTKFMKSDTVVMFSSLMYSLVLACL